MLSIEDVATRTLVVDAVLKAIPQERRDKLVQEAITTLLVPRGEGRYGEPKTSTLEDAFRSAAYDVARKHAEEWLQTDPKFANAVKTLTSEVVEKMLASEAREKIVQGITGAVTSAFEKAARSY